MDFDVLARIDYIFEWQRDHREPQCTPVRQSLIHNREIETGVYI